jgi:hypothetical protein
MSVEGVIEANAHGIDGEVALRCGNRRGRIGRQRTNEGEIASTKGLRFGVEVEIFEFDGPGSGDRPFDAETGDPTRRRQRKKSTLVQ